jgi:hypothetical protein
MSNQEQRYYTFPSLSVQVCHKNNYVLPFEKVRGSDGCFKTLRGDTGWKFGDNPSAALAVGTRGRFIFRRERDKGVHELERDREWDMDLERDLECES